MVGVLCASCGICKHRHLVKPLCCHPSLRLKHCASEWISLGKDKGVVCALVAFLHVPGYDVGSLVPVEGALHSYNRRVEERVPGHVEAKA